MGPRQLAYQQAATYTLSIPEKSHINIGMRIYAQSTGLALWKWNALDNYHNYQTGETVSPLIQSACMHSQQAWPCGNGMH